MVGVQFPGFMDQYQKRVEAHFQEVRTNLSGFQATADRYFNGSLEDLIAHYRNSPDPVFQQDAGSLERLYQRYHMLLAQHQAMSGPWYQAGFHLLFFHNDDLMHETFARYSYTVPLAPRAIVWGVGVAFFVSLVLEILLVSICSAFWPGARATRSRLSRS